MFAFALASTAIIQSSGERGQIVSRSESTFAEPQYLLRYKSADGRAVEQWWSQGALQAERAEQDAGGQLVEGLALTVTPLPTAAALPLTVAQDLHRRLDQKERELKLAEADFQSLSERLGEAQKNCSTLSRAVTELRQVVSPA